MIHNFIHIPRTGGTSIRQACASNPLIINKEHLFSNDLEHHSKQKGFYTCRNPFDRLISLYEFMTNRRWISHDMKFEQFVNQHVVRYKNLKCITGRRDMAMKRMLANQSVYVPVEYEYTELRFETFEQDFNKYMNDNELKHNVLSHVNSVDRRYDSQEEYYSLAGVRDTVAEMYAVDFLRFNYNI